MKTVIIFIMIVCLCEGLTESELVHRIRAGARPRAIDRRGNALWSLRLRREAARAS
jgi:hypothetical protein